MRNSLLYDALACKGWSQRKLAEQTGIHASTISRYLNGERVPKVNNIHKISEALDMDPMEILNYYIKGEHQNGKE